MAKVNLGEKRVCPECGSKFYDLTKRPAVCPKCEFSFNPDELAAVAAAVPVSQIKPQAESGNIVDEPKAAEDEEEVDEEEAETKELELDGDDASLMSGATTDNEDQGRTPDFDAFSSGEDEDEDAALVDDEEETTLPPTAAEGDDDDAEEIEL